MTLSVPVRSRQAPMKTILEIFRSNGNDVFHTTFDLISVLYRTFLISKGHYHMGSCGPSPYHNRIADVMRGADEARAAASC